jgi:GlpG protein
MRPAGTIRDQRQARRFADYLLTQDIAARLDLTSGGWTVWVYDEEALPRVRAELDEFLREPGAPRFAVSREAERMRAQAREAQARRAEPQAPARPQEQQAARAQAQAPAPLTWALLVFSVVVALATGLGSPDAPYVADLTIATIHHDHLHHRDGVGQLAWAGLDEVRRGEVWRLITPIFLHFGATHLLFNGLVLLDLGRRVEAISGTAALAAMVLVFGVLGNVAQYLAAGPAFGGLSGVLYGLFGFIWVMARRAPGSGYAIRDAEVVTLAIWSGICLLGLVGPVGNAAHAAGFVAGLAVGAGAAALRRRRPPRG